MASFPGEPHSVTVKLVSKKPFDVLDYLLACGEIKSEEYVQDVTFTIHERERHGWNEGSGVFIFPPFIFANESRDPLFYYKGCLFSVSGGSWQQLGLIEGAIIALHEQEKKEEVKRRRYIPSAVRRAVWERDGGKCKKCGADTNLQYDHIIPVSRGGGSTEQNVELLCVMCNQNKSDAIQ